MMVAPGLYRRVGLAIVACTGLLLVYLFQRFNLAQTMGVLDPAGTWVVNKVARFLLNDFFALMLIYSLFPERKYIKFALLVQIFGTCFFLIPYVIMKLWFVEYTGPWINFLHRIILNPILIFLLIPAFFYQKKTERNNL